MSKKIITNLLLALVLLIISVPMLQHISGFGDDGKLGGHITNVANPVFNIKDWWAGTYQEQKTGYINDSMGFRPWIVRMNNEIDYRLLGKLHARDVVIGKNYYMYEKSYIDTYCGIADTDYDIVCEQLYKLKKIQDTLAGMGVDFIFLYAPSKARFYPEYFPGKHECSSPSFGVYGKYLHIMDSLDIRYIDFNGWFVKMKDTSKGLLMSKQGIHWTTYGAMLAGDSLVKYLVQQRGFYMPSLVIEGMHTTTVARNSDADIGCGLNLLSTLAVDTFAYPDYSYRPSGNNNKKPNAIFLGDSFLWTYQHFWLTDNINNKWELWFYFREVWNMDVFKETTPVMKREYYNWQQAIEETDIFVMQFTEPCLAGFGFGFIDVAYKYYYGEM